MDNHFWPFYPICVTNSTPPHDLASNSPRTYRVVMVAQTVVTTTMTSELSKKPWTIIFDYFISFVPPIQHHYTTQHPILYQPIGLSLWHKLSLWQQWRHNYRKKMDNHFWPFHLVCTTNSKPSHVSSSNSPRT